MAFVHIKGKTSIGKTRSEQCENLRKVYGVSGGMSDEQLDKTKYLERKITEKHGGTPWIPGGLTEDVK